MSVLIAGVGVDVGTRISGVGVGVSTRKKFSVGVGVGTHGWCRGRCRCRPQRQVSSFPALRYSGYGSVAFGIVNFFKNLFSSIADLYDLEEICTNHFALSA